MLKLFKIVATFTDVYEAEVEAHNEDEARYLASHAIDWGVAPVAEYSQDEYEVTEITDD